MFRRYLTIISVFIVLAVLTGCGETFQIINDGTPSRSLSSYSKIHVGWIDLDESKWKKYEYENAAMWKTKINEMNVDGIQPYMKKFLPGKTYTGAKSRTNRGIPASGLYVKFKVKELQRNYNQVWGGVDYLIVDVSFIDARSRKTILRSSVKTASSSGPVHQWAFEGRLSNTIYNLARFISAKMK